MVDFEIALQNALNQHFPSSKILGCKFHFIQANSRWLSSHGVTGDEKLKILHKLSKLAECEEDLPKSIKGFFY